VAYILVGMTHGTSDSPYMGFAEQLVAVCDAKSLILEWPNKRIFSVTPHSKPALPERTSHNAYAVMTGYAPDVEGRSPDTSYGAPIDLLHVLDSAILKCHRDSGSTVSVDVDNGSQSLLLDASRDYAIVRRVWKSPQGRTLQIATCLSVTESCEGWRPHPCTQWTIHRFPSEGSRHQVSPYSIWICTITSTRRGPTDDAIALRKYAAGSLEYVLADDEFTQVIPGGLDLIEIVGARLEAWCLAHSKVDQGWGWLLVLTSTTVLALIATQAFLNRGLKANLASRISNRIR